MSAPGRGAAREFCLRHHPLADGWHQLTAVAYEGTSVGTQTRVTRSVLIQNTGLTATLAALPAGSVATPDQTLQFTVTAGTTNLARSELFSREAPWGDHQSTDGVFTVNAASLAWACTPFSPWSPTSPGSGTKHKRSVIESSPWRSPSPARRRPVWPAWSGRQYDLQFTTNLTSAFQTLTTLTATNAAMQWPLTTTAGRAITACGWIIEPPRTGSGTSRRLRLQAIGDVGCDPDKTGIVLVSTLLCPRTLLR